MSHEPTVRRASPRDHDELLRLASRALEHLRPQRGGAVFLGREARQHPLGETVAADLESMSAGRTTVLVGCLGDVPVGYGVAHPEATADAPLWVIDDLYVEPEARGVGVGRLLLETLTDEAVRNGCGGIQAEVLPGDRATKNFFEGSGLVARKITVHRSLAPDGTVGG